MSTMLNTVREQRQRTWDQAKSMLDKAVREKRELTPHEQTTYDELVADLQESRAMIDHLEDREQRISASEASLRKLADTPRDPGSGYRSQPDPDAERLRTALLRRSGEPIDVRSSSPRSYYQPGVEARAGLTTTGPANFRPVGFYGRIVETMVETSAVLRAGATVIATSTGEDLRVPRSTGLSTAQIVTETNPIPESDPTFSVVTLGAFKYAVLVTVSNEMLEDDQVDIEGYLAHETGVALGNALGQHLLAGTGVGQPTGVLSDATTGITAPTGCATSFGSQATAGQGTDLLNGLVASLAEPYTRSAAAGFLLRTASLANLRNLKSSQGELVGNEFISGSPWPYFVDPFVPAMAANAKSVLYGDWSRVFVRLVNNIRFEQSREVAFNTDQTVFRAVMRADGRLIDPSAVKYLVNSAN